MSVVECWRTSWCTVRSNVGSGRRLRPGQGFGRQAATSPCTCTHGIIIILQEVGGLRGQDKTLAATSHKVSWLVNHITVYALPHYIYDVGIVGRETMSVQDRKLEPHMCYNIEYAALWASREEDSITVQPWTYNNFNTVSTLQTTSVFIHQCVNDQHNIHSMQLVINSFCPAYIIHIL